ncbi:MAG: hypothetical protein Kow0047_24510 [Anaerolineae bacterium]
MAQADVVPAGEVTLEAINARLDALSAQIAFLTEQAEQERRRREQWDDLWHDVSPILNGVYTLAVEQLEEASPYVQLEDIMRLLTRALRSVRMLEELLQELESLHDLLRDVGPISHDAFQVIVQKLDEMDKKGYFPFLKESTRILDEIVTNFTVDDVRALADNIVLILNTVKQLTQPDIVTILQEFVSAYRQIEAAPEQLDISTLGLLRQMRDPEVRRGLALTLQLLRTVSVNRPAVVSPSGGNGNGRQ